MSSGLLSSSGAGCLPWVVGGGCLVPEASSPWETPPRGFVGLVFGATSFWVVDSLHSHRSPPCTGCFLETAKGGCVGAKLGGKGRHRLDLTSVVLDGPGPAAGQTTQKLNQALCRKGVLFLQGPTGTQTSSSLALQLRIFSLSPKYLLVGAVKNHSKTQ